MGFIEIMTLSYVLTGVVAGIASAVITALIISEKRKEK